MLVYIAVRHQKPCRDSARASHSVSGNRSQAGWSICFDPAQNLFLDSLGSDAGFPPAPVAYRNSAAFCLVAVGGRGRALSSRLGLGFRPFRGMAQPRPVLQSADWPDPSTGCHCNFDFQAQTLSHHGLMYAMVSATDVAICAACNAVVQFRVPILGVLSGTTIQSPGFRAAFKGLPDHQPALFFAAITEPSARITKTASLSASWVTPPACVRYQRALLPGL